MHPLKKNDIVGIVSPSSPLAGIFQYRLERGIVQLKEMGFRVKIGKNAKLVTGYTAGTAKDRADDFMEFIKDDEIAAIICSIGGGNSNELLPLLDFDLIKSHPKPIIGYSDITVLLLSIYRRTGLTTFYGPTLLTEFAENGGMHKYSKNEFLKVCMNRSSHYELVSSEEAIIEKVLWGNNEIKHKERKRIKKDSLKFIKNGDKKGKLIAMCIESVYHILPTTFMPDLEDSIVFIETSSDNPNLSDIDSFLSDLLNIGIVSKLNGLVFGYKNWDKSIIDKLCDLLYSKLSSYDFPVVYGLDFGHISPICTLPIGSQVRLNSFDHSISICSSPFNI